ncbi:MAG: signal peptide peptidase SppA [Prevotella sp.]|nr:signal peptide peptidase SppA [Prevotella sp.]
MKEFFKYVGATVVGLIITGILVTIFFFISLAGFALAGSKTASVSDNSVLVLNLSGMLSERSESSPLSQFSKKAQSVGLNDILTAIEKAKKNDKVKGIYIESGLFVPDSYASLQAIRNALQDFKKSKKWVMAYGDSYTQGAYYVSSVADSVFLNPSGQIDWHGLASQPVFYKDLLAKFGVKVEVAKVGTYKSYTETYTADKMSDANREQTTAFLNIIWKNITQAVSQSRHIPVVKLNEYADSMIVLADTKDFVKTKFVDRLLYTDQVKDVVKKKLGVSDDDDINQVSVSDMIGDDSDTDDGGKIAVYYAYGSIVDGAVSPMSGDHEIDGQKVCRDLEELAKDDDIKAVVLRVNSGGGSAYASEQIWHQVMELKKKKPVVVSMGGMAASGAYYMSAPANWIVAEPTTLTGSIGIFGMFPDASGLLKDKLGLKFDVVKTNAHSDFQTIARPFSPEEKRYMEGYITRGYQLFRKRVADGRHMTTEQVEKIAQGHVFAGEDAIRLHLVDQLGGLDAAVAKAAQLAKLPDYSTEDYPAEDSWIDAFLSDDIAGNYLDGKLRTELGPLYEPVMFLRNINKTEAVQARIPYIINVE